MLRNSASCAQRLVLFPVWHSPTEEFRPMLQPTLDLLHLIRQLATSLVTATHPREGVTDL
ncbi:MAG: hypothetical protein JWO13_20 [Acidobacteriales bacterium]|nr:hypothetical protein [Terriglobales bacterium]